jgi:hypothetical protein
MVLKLQNFSTTDDGTRITRVGLVVADHLDPAQRKEWLDVLVSVDLPVVRNGALLRAEVLKKARDTLDALATHYETLGRRVGESPFGHRP